MQYIMEILLIMLFFHSCFQDSTNNVQINVQLFLIYEIGLFSLYLLHVDVFLHFH